MCQTSVTTHRVVNSIKCNRHRPACQTWTFGSYESFQTRAVRTDRPCNYSYFYTWGGRERDCCM